MNKERWNKIGAPAPVSKEHPCEPNDVVSHYGGFHLKLVVEVEEDGVVTDLLVSKSSPAVLSASGSSLAL